MEKKSLLKNKFITILAILIAIIGICSSGYFYLQYRNTLNNPIVAGQMEAQDLVKKISQLMLLPENEVPTVATVSDINKLKDQPFFHNSHNGDKLLIYTKAKVAILYDTKLDKIINVGPLNIGQPSEQAAGTTSIRIALYNGTNVAGLTNTIEQQLKSKVSNVTISVKENAKNTYKKTLVVDLVGNQQKAASDLATLLNADIVTLPEGETAPSNTDLLVIIGR